MARKVKYNFLTLPSLAGHDDYQSTPGTPDLSITRATAAWDTDADGWIRKYQSGEARFTGATFSHNLFGKSLALDTVPWNNAGNAVMTSGQADPFGGTDAYKFVDDGAGGAQDFVIWTQNVAIGTQPNHSYTVSIYAKADGVNWLYIDFNAFTGAGDPSAYFDLANGVLGTVDPDATAAIEDVGGGWYRCSITGTLSSDVAGNIRFILAEADGDRLVDQDGTSSVILYGAQLEVADSRTTPSTFIETTGIQGVLSTSLTGTSTKGLLVEVAATNRCIYSEDYSNTWVSDNITDTPGSETAPDGSETMQLLTENTSLASHRIYENIGATTAAQVNCLSIFVKAGTRRYLTLGQNTGGTDYFYACFDSQNSFAVTETGAAGGGSYFDSGVEDYGNGVYRIWVSGSDSVGGGTFFIFNHSDSATPGNLSPSFTGTSATSYSWGAQYEEGAAAPTSYIPTVASTVTRNAEVVNTTDVSWHNIVEGTFYCEASLTYGGDATGQNYIYSLDDGTETDRIIQWINQSAEPATGNTIVRVASNNVTQAQPIASGRSVHYQSGVPTKTALGVKKDDFAFYLDGVEAGIGSPDTSGNMPQDELTTLNLGCRLSSDFQLNGHISEFMYWDERFSDPILAEVSNGDFSNTEDQVFIRKKARDRFRRRYRRT